MAYTSIIKQIFQRDKGWLIAFGVMLCVYLYLAGLLMTSFDFNDETEKLITARLIHSGLGLYKDIFVQHGPVAYIPSHILYSIFGSHSLVLYRIIPIILSLLALSAVMASPLYTIRRTRLITGIVFLFGLIALQAHYALVMTMYQVYAGYFYIIALALFIFPFAIGLSVKPWHAIISGFCLSMVFFCAFSYSIAILFCLLLCWFGIIITTPKSRALMLFYSFCGGGVAGTLLTALWVWLYGDFLGYFVDHIYINLTAYKYYLGGINIFNPLLLALNPFFLWNYRLYYPFSIFILPLCSMLLLFISVFKLRLFGSKVGFYIVYSILMMCAVAYVNPRMSGGFGGSTYVLVCISLVAFTAGFIFQRANLLPSLFTKLATGIILLMVFSGILIQFTVKTFLYETSSYEYYKYKAVLGPMDSEEMRLLRQVVGEDETVLQLPFSLNFYIWADRLPASGIFFWMPWMQLYTQNPIEGYPLDLCRQMNESPPKAIYYTDFAIWGHPPETYLACFKKLLKERYFLSNKVTNVWFRDDVVRDNKEVLGTVLAPEN